MFGGWLARGSSVKVIFRTAEAQLEHWVRGGGGGVMYRVCLGAG